MDDPEAAETPEEQQPQNANRPLSIFLLFTWVLFMLTSSPKGEKFATQTQLQDAVQSLTYQLSNYTTWLHGAESEFSLPEISNATVPLVSSLVHFTGHLDPWNSYYSNITGFTHGHATFYNISTNSTEPWNEQAQQFMADVNTTDMQRRSGSWNWATSDRIVLRVAEKRPDDPEHLLPTDVSDSLRLIHGTIELTDQSTSEDLHFDFEGVHFLSNGSIYGFAEPAGRHVDIRWLPAIVPPAYINETARFILPELNSRIRKLNDMIDAGTTEEAVEADHTKPSCPFMFHGQLLPTLLPRTIMREMEAEVESPTGLWVAVQRPKIELIGTLLSQECGIMFKIDDTIGMPLPIFFRKITRYASTSCLVYLLLLVLLSRQMKAARTPIAISRISRWGFIAQIGVDAAAFVAHLTFAILLEGKPSTTLVMPGFLAIVVFTYECHFVFTIRQIQVPEETARPPRLAVQVTTSTTTSTSSSATASPVYPSSPSGNMILPRSPLVLPTPVVQPSARLATIATFWSETANNQQVRTIVLIILGFVVFVSLIYSPFFVLICVAAAYSALWLPQIVRSARRGRSSGLNAEYIIGTTLGRLYFALYLLACPHNVLDVPPTPWVYALTVFVSLQAVTLILQEHFGAGFFLPRKYAAVQVYDYHPPLPALDTESPELSLGDCAICMDSIDAEKSIDEKRDHEGLNHSSSITLRIVGGVRKKNYSLAPCHHLFHTKCLERWLAIKSICPQCRRPLPPL